MHEHPNKRGKLQKFSVQLYKLKAFFLDVYTKLKWLIQVDTHWKYLNIKNKRNKQQKPEDVEEPLKTMDPIRRTIENCCLVGLFEFIEKYLNVDCLLQTVNL